MDCNFNNNEVKCPDCGFIAGGRDWRRNCPAKVGIHQPTPSGLPLGDYVEAGLSAIGITKERVDAVIGSCFGCPQRQKWLNTLGDWIARKAKGENIDSEIDDSGI